jgi:hypothetical protein
MPQAGSWGGGTGARYPIADSPVLRSSAFMQGVKSTDAFNPMNSGSAMRGISEAAFRSNTASVVLLPSVAVK